MTHKEWMIEVQARQSNVQKAQLELQQFVQETTGVNLAQPIGIEAVSLLAASVVDMKAQESK